MSHRAALYRVQIRPMREVDSWRLLGDYDEAGTWAGHTINGLLVKLNGTSRDKKVQAQFESNLPSLQPDCVGVSVLSGRSGVTSVLELEGERPFLRTPEHSEAMRTAVLFDLPPRRLLSKAPVVAAIRRGVGSVCVGWRFWLGVCGASRRFETQGSGAGFGVWGRSGTGPRGRVR